MINKLGGEKYLDTILKTFDEKFLKDFQGKYKETLSKLGYYATTHPCDTVGCDLASRLTSELDKEKLIPNENLLKNSPYLKKPHFTKEDEFNQTIRRFFNGDFK
jgi:hypothetical protein